MEQSKIIDTLETYQCAEEQVAAPSRRLVQQLAAPSQLVEEWRVAPEGHAGEHDGGGIMATVDEAVSDRSSHAIRRQRSQNRALPVGNEAGFTEINETASTSVTAADSEEK